MVYVVVYVILNACCNFMVDCAEMGLLLQK